VDVPYFLSKYDPDPLRFYLTATAPPDPRPRAALRDLKSLDTEDRALLEMVEASGHTFATLGAGLDRKLDPALTGQQPTDILAMEWLLVLGSLQPGIEASSLLLQSPTHLAKPLVKSAW
jgi:hypothetical protein